MRTCELRELIWVIAHGIVHYSYWW
jgi:hypothetical protein